MGLTLLIFLTVTLSVAAGFQVLSSYWSADERRVRQRMADEFNKNKDGTALKSPLFKNPEQLTLDQAPAPELDKQDAAPVPVRRVDLRSRLESLLEQADVPLTLPQLFLIAAVLGLGLGIAGTILRGFLLGMTAAAVGSAAPLVFLHVKRTARREKFLRQLPNAFDLMGRVLRAGHSVPQALQAVAESFENPLAAEFASCHQQLGLGLQPEVTFQEMAQRCGVVEMRIFVMAMLIQRQTGGNLAEVLERLSGLVRARLRLRNQVRTFTAEGRMQGLTLIALPFVIFGAMMLINRTYAQVLLQHTTLLLATLGMMALGVLWIRKIVHIDY